MNDVRVIVLVPNEPHRPAREGSVSVEALSMGRRTGRALRILAILWGIAIASVFIPILHFVLVPGFLVAGSYGAWRVHRRTARVLGGQISCPRCDAAVTLQEPLPAWPAGLNCPSCGAGLALSPVSAPG